MVFSMFTITDFAFLSIACEMGLNSDVYLDLLQFMLEGSMLAGV